MLDFVAHRYGILPSELMTRGSSFDVLVAEVAQRYQNRVAEASKKGGRVKPATPELSQAEMLAMIERARKPR